MKKGYVFFICGVTGAGKGTLIKGLLNENIKNLDFVLSCKTRDLREGEIDGIDYIKLSFDEFEKQINAGEFLEYNFVHNQNYYGTRKKDIIENGIEKGKIILKEIDMLIVPEVLEKMSSYRDYFSIIFLDLPIESIKDRMLLRGDDVLGNDYKNRVESAEKEKSLAYLADFIVDGLKDPRDVLSEVKEIIISKS